MSEQRKILDMLAAGQITAEEANELLSAIGPTRPVKPAAPKGVAKMVRISIDASEGKVGKGKAKVNVNVPAPLAKFAMQFIPKGVRAELEAQGIDLDELLDVLKGELPEGRLVDIDAGDEGDHARIVIEVV